MTSGPILETARLRLRPWRDDDVAAFAAMSADPEVMRFFPAVLSLPETAAMVGRLVALADAHGISFLPIEDRGSGEFLGLAGMAPVVPPMPCAPAVEIGWRLKRAAWGQGYASEAAAAWLDFGFAKLRLSEIVAFAVQANLRSRAVMQRIGMRHDPGADFDHPRLPAGHGLARHVLYRVARD